MMRGIAVAVALCWALSVGSAFAACSYDGSSFAETSAQNPATSTTLSITTPHDNEIVLLHFVTYNEANGGATITSLADTGAHMWEKAISNSWGQGPAVWAADFEVWWALFPTAGNYAITLGWHVFSGSRILIAASGFDTDGSLLTPFDTNAAVPSQNFDNTSVVGTSPSTVFANDGTKDIFIYFCGAVGAAACSSLAPSTPLIFNRLGGQVLGQASQLMAYYVSGGPTAPFSETGAGADATTAWDAVGLAIECTTATRRRPQIWIRS